MLRDVVNFIMIYLVMSLAISLLFLGLEQESQIHDSRYQRSQRMGSRRATDKMLEGGKGQIIIIGPGEFVLKRGERETWFGERKDRGLKIELGSSSFSIS